MPNNDNELITPAIAIEFPQLGKIMSAGLIIFQRLLSNVCVANVYFACTDTHIFCDEMSAEL